MGVSSEEAKINIYHTLKKNEAKTFGFTPTNRAPAIMGDLKNDVKLLSRAFIVSQNRELNLDAFFEFENTSAPPSLSSNVALRPSAKAQLLKILEESAEQPAFEENADANQ
ncbi:unnamed protein product [Bemisia tabaci]|uniref:Uncharacterized protein n=1 Tax=Bemisia tabaci TaxID=7038 RepID=A0A9P0AFR5_BEMTA|nr:unnamed protein product [Bemisia tabaci]